MEDELSMAIENAVSFPGSNPPEDYIVLGKAKPRTVEFIYYKGLSTGTYYFASESGIEFARKMEEIIKRDKKEKHRFH